MLAPMLSVMAQERESATMFGVSGVTQWDTYLSNERYHGGGLTVASQISRPTHWMQRRLYVQHLTQGSLAIAEPRSDKHKTINGFFHWQVGWMYHFLASQESGAESGGWEMNAGAGVQTRLGFVYNTLGGNNPASARAAVNLIAMGQVRRHFELWRKPFMATLQADVPLTGLFFTPDYGQSYYEIFSRGNYDHNIVPTTFVATPNLRHMLSIDYGVSRSTTLRLSYLGDYQQAKVNNLKSHIYHHRVMIGIVRTLRVLKNSEK